MCRGDGLLVLQLSPAAVGTDAVAGQAAVSDGHQSLGLTALETTVQPPLQPRLEPRERGESDRRPGKHGQSAKAQPGRHRTHRLQQSSAEPGPRADTVGEPGPRHHSQAAGQAARQGR